jgi:hypothetical protein
MVAAQNDSSIERLSLVISKGTSASTGAEYWRLDGAYSLAPAVNDNSSAKKSSVFLYWGRPRYSENNHVVTVAYRAEFISEGPVVSSLRLNLETLRGTIRYAKWPGYVRTGVPSVRFEAVISCSSQNEGT